MVSCTAHPIPAATVAPLRIDTTTKAPAIDICIVGAGVVGLALARELSGAFPAKEILLLERHDEAGQETSSRNSEVIHAGIYYPPGSLKAVTCIRGRNLLYDYCAQHQIPHKRIGKLLVASEAESSTLENIQRRAQANGVESLQLLDKWQIRALEPAVKADVALWSPETGIVDSHSLMQCLLREAQARGVTFARCSVFAGAAVLPDHRGIRLSIESVGESMLLDTRVLINSAGLYATEVARCIEGIRPDAVPEIDYIKGNYLGLSGKSPFTHLIYPAPDPAQRGLGIHATLDLAGQCRFGPDIEPVSTIDFSVDESRIPLFAQAILKYYPGLQQARLQPAYAGIRPRIRTAAAAIADFVIQDVSKHDVAGLWQLFGIESPGLTASMALAEHVRDLIIESAILS